VTTSRSFTPWQRMLLFHAADGRCQECGVPLEQNWHADHIVPWAAGGPTDLANGRALCRRCNQMKGGPKRPPKRRARRGGVLIGARVRQARKAAGLTQWALSIRAGITVNAVSELERDVTGNPRSRTIQAIARALDLTVGDLLAEPDPEPEEANR
jgi:DNA-binding XRE family transcriptional regulator